MPFASNQGTRIHYETVGHGRPLVLHHGFTETLESWNRKGFVAALKAHYALILLDSRGHGSSDKPHAPESYGLRNGAMDVVCVLDALRVERAHYCGYSLGGWIGFGLARHAPERLLSLVVGGAQPYGQSLAVYRGMLQEDLQTCLSHLERAAGGPLPAPLRDAFFQNDIHALRAAYAKDREDISDGLCRGSPCPACCSPVKPTPSLPRSSGVPRRSPTRDSSACRSSTTSRWACSFAEFCLT